MLVLCNWVVHADETLFPELALRGYDLSKLRDENENTLTFLRLKQGDKQWILKL